MTSWLSAHVDLVREVKTLRREVSQRAASEAHKDELIRSLRDELRRLRLDIDLLALCVHPSKRQDALAFVRDQHRIEAS